MKSDLSMRRRRNCDDLDLSLSSPSANYYYDLLSTSHTTNSSPDAETMEGVGGGSSSASHQQQPLTIIFNGKVCVSDVTELQARAILCHASRSTEEMDDQRLIINTTTTPDAITPCSSSLPPSPSLLLQSPTSTTPTTTATTPCSSSLPPSPSLLLQSPTSTTPTTAAAVMNMNDISMKRSLQRFLQKRKNRIQSFSSHPYNNKQ